MATKKIEELEDVVVVNDPTTVVVEKKEEGYKGPTVRVFLPRLEEEGNGIRVDQYEHVTISNEVKEERWFVKRGEYADVPMPVYAVLKEKYPDI